MRSINRKKTKKETEFFLHFFKNSALFIVPLSVVIVFLLFILTFYSESYIDLAFVVSFIIFSVLVYILSIAPRPFVGFGLLSIFLAGWMLLFGYSQYAEIFSQWAFLFLSFTIGYSFIYFFIHKKDIA